MNAFGECKQGFANRSILTMVEYDIDREPIAFQPIVCPEENICAVPDYPVIAMDGSPQGGFQFPRELPILAHWAQFREIVHGWLGKRLQDGRFSFSTLQTRSILVSRMAPLTHRTKDEEFSCWPEF